MSTPDVTPLTAEQAILLAMEGLGGEATIGEVERWIADHALGSWVDIRTPMADLCEPPSPSASKVYPRERRFLERVDTGRYRIRDDWQQNDQSLSSSRPLTRSRKAFIESHGATCRNWTWSWSFVNHERRFVIFGAWDMHTQGNRAKILDEAWALTPAGKRSAAYPQSREHVRLVEEDAYELYTFAMQHSDALKDGDGIGPARIAGFDPHLSRRSLVRTGGQWYASDDHGPLALPEELPSGGLYREGAAVEVLVNGYERNGPARRACIAHYGATCQVCGFDFERHYGPMGRGVIHVHHRTPLAHRDGEYDVDPIRDLIPVCPNCHAMIHLTKEPLDIETLRQLLSAYGHGHGSRSVAT